MTQTAPAPAPQAGAPMSTDPAIADAKVGTQEALARPMGSRVHSSTRRALEAMHKAAGELDEAVRTVRGEGARTQGPRPQTLDLGSDGKPTVTGGGITSGHRGDVRMAPGGTLRAFSGDEPALVDAANSRFATVARKVDTTLADLSEVETTLAGAVANKLVDPRAETNSGVALGSEIRSYVRGLDKPERFRFLTERVEAGDLSTTSAVINAASFLSGLDDDSIATVRELASAKFAPIESSAIASAREARAIVERAGQAFAKQWNHTVRSLGPGRQKTDDAIARVKGGAA